MTEKERTDSFEVFLLATDPKCRGQGIGRALLEHVEKLVSPIWHVCSSLTRSAGRIKLGDFGCKRQEERTLSIGCRTVLF